MLNRLVLWVGLLAVCAPIFGAESIMLVSDADTTYYDAFPDALKVANKQPQAHMKLLDDVSFDGAAATQTIKTNLTLDLNGYSLGDSLSSDRLLSLAVDSLTLRIFSSRPGGRIHVARTHDGTIYAIYCSKGTLNIDGITIEGSNVADDIEAYPKASVRGVYVGAQGTLTMNHTKVSVIGSGTANALHAAGNATSAPTIDVRNCQLTIRADKSSSAVYCLPALTMDSCEIDAQTGLNAYGINITPFHRDLSRSDTTRVTHTSIKVFSTKGAYGIQAKGHLFLAHDSLRAEAIEGNVYGVSAGNTAQVTIHDCDLIAKGSDGTKSIYMSGDKKSSAIADIRRCNIVARGRKNSFGISCYGTSSIEDCAIEVLADSDTYAYGVQVNNFKDTITLQDAEATITHVVIRAKAANRAYGIYTKAPIVLLQDTVYGQTERDNCMGFYAQNDSAHFALDRCAFTVEAGYNSAYGAYLYRGHMTARDCFFCGTSRQDTTQAKPLDTNARGVLCGDYSSAVLDRCTLIAKGTNNIAARNVWSLYLNRTAQAGVANCTLTAEGMDGVAGFYGAGDANSKSIVNLRDCEISGKGKQKIYGVQLSGKGQITNCKMNVQADSASYVVYTGTNCDTVDVRDCYLKINTSNKSGVLNLNKKAFGLFTIQGGFYTDDTNLKAYLPSDTCAVYRIKSGVEYSAGYRYVIRDTGNPGVTVAQVYETGKTTLLKDFNSLASALLYTIYDDTKNYTVVVTADCRLNESDYYIPANVTLVVAYREGQKAAMGTKPLREDGTNAKPFEHVRLTMKSGARMIVDGIIEVSAVQKRSYNIEGCVSGDYGYGRIHMESGSSITLGRGAQLRAWGYITGQGTITAQAGAAVYEQLQIGEWKGGTVTYNLINNPKRVFPFTHFFYQNIEAPITYQAGAKAFGSTYIAVSVGSVACDDIRLLADKDALFIMPTDDPEASVSKVYDPLTDRVTWTTRGQTALSELSLIMRMGGFDFSMPSSHYILPVGTYMTIRAESGTLTVENDVSLLPGARVEVAPGAQALIPQGTKLYVYDIDDWGTWCDRSQFTVNYSPSWTDCPRDTILPSARMIIGGEMRIEGSLYTTEHGAEIRGSEETEGQVLLANQPQPEDYIYQVTGSGFDFVYSPAALTPARLLNADGTFTPTQGAKAGTTFTYAAGQWTCPQDAYEAIDQITNGHPITNKRIQDGRLYITVGDKQYTATGQLTR